MHLAWRFSHQSHTSISSQPNDGNCPVGWDSRIHQLLLCKGVGHPSKECSGYDTKQPNGEVSVMLELWRMRSNSASLLLPGPLWFGVVAPDRVLSMCQIKLNCVLMLNWIIWNGTVFWHWNCIFMQNWIVWNRTVLTFKLPTYDKLNCLL